MGKGRILLVEDEGIVARDVQGRLGAIGFDADRWVVSGPDAVAAVCADPPDLVLMDIQLRNGMDGIEAARAIQACHRVPVVYLTAHADEATLTRAMGTEPFGYVLKPFQDRELQVAIEIALFKHATEQTLRRREEELQRINADLVAEKAFLEALFAAMPSPVLVVGADGTVRASNATPGREPKRSAEGGGTNLPGDLLRCVNALGIPGSCGCLESCSQCGLRSTLNEVFGGGRVHRRRVEMAARGGNGKERSAVTLLSATPLDYGGERMAVVVVEDVTELEGLRRLVGGPDSCAGMVGGHPKMLEVYQAIREVADLSCPVLITGESGTGKELVARAIHSTSNRSESPFVVVNCAALPEGLLESELFGHVKGAFTGAIRDKKGRFELADGGTIFLDEVGDLSPALQVKLLRVLQEQRFERVGDERTLEVTVRVVAATNRDLRRAISEGTFREDLFYRLCVVPIHLPPLRERGDDVALLAAHALERAALRSGRAKPELSSEALAVLTSARWPGNVRELQNALEYAIIKSRGGVIEAAHLPTPIAVGQPVVPVRRPGRGALSLPLVEAALRRCDGNRSRAARVLGVSRATLYRYLADLQSHPA